MRRRGLEVVGAGVIAAAVIACGDAAMNGAGGMLGDAGELMSDAGQMMMDAGGQMMSDAGQMMMDAGGQVMRDAGQVMRDAGEVMRDAGGVMRDGSTGMMDSAMAQSCEACSAGGRPTVVTAENDIEQLRSGTIEGAGWVERRGTAYSVTAGGPCSVMYQGRALTAEIVEGPFVLTDLRWSSSTSLQIYTVASGAACFESAAFQETVFDGCTNPAQITGQRVARPASSRTVFAGSAQVASRIWIPADQKLCVYTGEDRVRNTTAGALFTDAILAWSGFVPYE